MDQYVWSSVRCLTATNVQRHLLSARPRVALGTNGRIGVCRPVRHLTATCVKNHLPSARQQVALGTNGEIGVQVRL